MGAYIVQSDIENAVGGTAELARITRSSPADGNKITSAIAYGESLINASAQGTAGYPWSVVPDAVKQANLSLSIYRLYYLSWPSAEIPATVKEQHDEALAFLKQLREGDISFVTGEDPAKQNLSRVFTYLPGQTLSSGNLRQATRDQLCKL